MNDNLLPTIKLKSNIPALIKKKGWNKNTFFGHVQLMGRSADVGQRAWDGETDFNVRTLALFVKIFDQKSIAQIVDVAPE